MAKTRPAEFLGEKLNIIEKDGQRWLTAEQVGRALGYTPGNERQGILKLYDRNKREFTNADKGVVNLTTPGGTQPTIVFSGTGCILLSFFSNTKRAARFRAWAKEVLAAPMLAPPVSPVVPARRKYVRTAPLLVTRAIEHEALKLFAEGWWQDHIAQHLGISKPTTSLLLRGKYQFCPAAGESLCTPELIEAVAQRFLEVNQYRMMAFHQRLAQSMRSTANNAALAAALDAIGQHFQQTPMQALLPMSK